MLKKENSSALFNRAKNFIPGGVNSPVRAFRAVGGNPIFMHHAKGAYLYDEDNYSYIDLINSWGPMILGHAHPVVEEAVKQALSGSPSFGAPTRREVEMAELICSLVPSIEQVRMVNSGTEATMAAIRVARGFTGRDKIIKMEGCYHGHADSFLIAAGSGALTFGVPDSPGVTKGVANDTLTAPFNNIEAIEKLLIENKNQVAAIILEPVVGNMGCVIPEENYLQRLRNLCNQHEVVLIFDEVMTGFRLALGGAQELYGVKPDMTTLGKIVGGGLPVGAYGGKKEIMSCVSPAGPVYQAGTLSGNPLAMAAGMALLTHLKNNPQVYANINETGKTLAAGLMQQAAHHYIPAQVNQVGSMFTLFFTKEKVSDYETAKKSDTALFGKYFNAMLEQGVYLAPSQFEAMFISNSIGKEEIDKILIASDLAFKSLS
ncbi:MAG: glutamate-1-semialdehyde 2,1-aminomutase [Cyclobacteriaceae bacterium]|jgi:glutamate-1-semialdehyde 2,1-aminomutase|nr:glutamate-1-semialdehyde 2,1-aminomutase [Cytophagales bacterium]MCZ8329061.1 glutamate-1-semialdehyde 2,1-aminomutase [Cyclobacteriaceae bacterium]